ncbi:MAG: ABC transporter substrate-binding protein [Psychromonas sp.]|nr:ABC transporter substrate-binding protein [Psychromonas sp.]
MKRIFKLLALTLLLLSSFTTSAAEKVLRIGITQAPTNLNPLLMQGVYAESLAGNMFDTLVSFKESAKQAEPLLAESWEISGDGKTYTFHLRKGVKFHNGQPFTSADVKYTFEATLDEKNASPNREFLKPIQAIETPDAYTLILKLNAPSAPFLLALANPTLGILPAKALKEMGMQAFDRHPIGTGAFKFVEMVPDDHITLAKNKDYFVAEPKLDKVVFRPIPKLEVMSAELQAGGIDLAFELLPQDMQRLKDEGLVIQSVPGMTLRYIGFSAKTLPFSDLRFRKAVYYAVPFAQAIPGIFKGAGERAYSWIPPGVIGDDLAYMKSKALSYDMGKAKQLIKELKAEGILKDGFEFDIYSPGDPARKQVATVLSTQLRALGLKVNVQTPEWSSLFPKLKAGDCGMYVMGWGSVPDPDRWTYRLFTPDSTMNFSKYDNSKVTEALEQGRILSDPAKRAQAYQTAMRQALTVDYIHIPLVWLKTVTGSSTKVKDFTPSPQKYIHLVTWKRNVDLIQ